VTEARAGHRPATCGLQPRAACTRASITGRRREPWHEGRMTGQRLRKSVARLGDSGEPLDLSLSRQNVCSTMKALERRIGPRGIGDPSADSKGPEWQGAGFH